MAENVSVDRISQTLTALNPDVWSPNKSIFVGNVAPQVTEEQLRKFFSVCGAISKAYIAKYVLQW